MNKRINVIKPKMHSKAALQDPLVGCGISNIYLFPETHPFHLPCVYHDAQYDKKFRGIQTRTRKAVDKQFFILMKNVARTNKSFKLRVLANVFYYIVRLVGWAWW